MPLKRCSKDGKSGWKYGDSGVCYVGEGARARAAEQGKAIEASKARRNKADEPAKRELKVKAATEELQIVWAEVYAPNIPDSHGDYADEEDIRKAAYGFMKAGRTGSVDIEHDNKLCGACVVESFIARSDDPVFIEGSWVVAIHIPDEEVWAKVKSGELNGFSMQAWATTEDGEVQVDYPAAVIGQTSKHEDDGHEHTFTIAFDAEGRFLGGKTDIVNGHMHQIYRGTVTESAKGHSHRFTPVDALLEAQLNAA